MAAALTAALTAKPPPTIYNARTGRHGIGTACGDERDRQRPTDLRLRAEGALLVNPRRPSLTGEPKELALAA